MNVKIYTNGVLNFKIGTYSANGEKMSIYKKKLIIVFSFIGSFEMSREKTHEQR